MSNNDTYEGDAQMRFESLKGKEFIEASKGKRLGYIQELDVAFDVTSGTIQSLIIPKYSILGIRKDHPSLRLEWKQIRVIGQDIILIDNN